MADYHNPSDDINASDADATNGFELLQSQLDAFLEQEKETVASGAGGASSEQQHRLDHFINNMQRQLDVVMEENPSHSSGFCVSDSAVGEKETVQVQSPHPSSRAEKIPAQPATTNPYFELSGMAEPVNPVPYSRLIVRVLIGASCASAIALWLFWPIEQTSLPMLGDQQRVDEHQPLAAMSAPEALGNNVNQSKESVVKETHANGLTQPVAAAPPKATSRFDDSKLDDSKLDDSNIQSTDQPKSKPNMTVKMKVIVRLGNIRNKPDKSGKVLYRLMQGAQVTRLAEQGDWFQVGLRSGAIAWGHRSIFEPAH